MTFGGAIRAGYANYFNFFGRASRSEYWWFQLWIVVLGFALVVPAAVAAASQPGSGARLLADVLALLVGLGLLGTLIPALALQVRRLHDSGHSGRWVLGAFLADIARAGWEHTMKAHPGDATALVALIIELLALGISVTILVFSLQRSKYRSGASMPDHGQRFTAP
ncbi:MAG TPA: DUF805 domain-containing protein [Acidocella sp.]|nr:DUF805 domain-containing protein [Acidocella sp.]